ncbi:MAG: hypothetical protein KYX67_10975 [Brevundimonas sp.]|jgi:hypothetical protein|nr:hypothetical protein [Brevundimonas sp.]MDK2747833.1 hypothetical protein [Brevundimonas sp.]
MNMKSTVRLAAVGAVLALSALSAAATAKAPGLMYHRTFYSDETLTTQVGFYRDRCVNGNVTASPVNGTTSPYYTLEAIGSCPGGYW